jgi:GNAT superfamily N-acetyltransferase
MFSACDADVGNMAPHSSAHQRARRHELRVGVAALGYTRPVTHTTVVIRPANKPDLAALVSLFAKDELLRSPRPGPAGTPVAQPEPVSGAVLAAFEDIAADPNNHVYVAELGGKVVGTFQLTFIRQLTYDGCLVAQVESVFVDESARSFGVGTRMLEYARAEAERRGAIRLQLTSNIKRERAHRFYERLGYRATHQGMKLYLEPPSRTRKAEA